MELYDITTLVRDDNQDGLYNLFEQTFSLKELPNFQYTVLPEQEMRIDLVCLSIYRNLDHVDMLLDLNSIDNPLNIKAGDIIYYVSSDRLNEFKVTIGATKENRRSLLSPNKSNVKDPNRTKYIEDNYQLPPTFLDTPQSPITIEKNNIRISPIR